MSAETEQERREREHEEARQRNRAVDPDLTALVDATRERFNAKVTSFEIHDEKARAE